MDGKRRETEVSRAAVRRISRFRLEMVGTHRPLSNRGATFSHRGAAGSVTAQVQSTRTVHVPWKDDDGVWHLAPVSGPLAQKRIEGSAPPIDANKWMSADSDEAKKIIEADAAAAEVRKAKEAKEAEAEARERGEKARARALAASAAANDFWNVGAFDCFSDIEICAPIFTCPCATRLSALDRLIGGTAH